MYDKCPVIYILSCTSDDFILHMNQHTISGNEVKEGDIRLVGGSYLWEGRVEIFLNGDWGTVCHDGAYNDDAAIVCRQLGYVTFSKLFSVCKCMR